MRSVATDVAHSMVFVFVCVLITRTDGCTLQKRLNQSRCRLNADLFGSKESCIRRGGQDWTNPFAVSRGYKSVMRPVAKLLFGFLIVLAIALWPIFDCAQSVKKSQEGTFLDIMTGFSK